MCAAWSVLSARAPLPLTVSCCCSQTEASLPAFKRGRICYPVSLASPLFSGKALLRCNSCCTVLSPVRSELCNHHRHQFTFPASLPPSQSPHPHWQPLPLPAPAPAATSLLSAFGFVCSGRSVCVESCRVWPFAPGPSLVAACFSVPACCGGVRAPFLPVAEQYSPVRCGLATVRRSVRHWRGIWVCACW